MAKVYQAIASALVAIRNCQKSGNVEWEERHGDNIAALVRQHLPSGGGFDAGTTFDLESNLDDKRERLTFITSFHHMDSNGSYAGWSEHKVILTPSFSGFHMKVTGRDRNAIKDYIGDTFYNALEAAA